MLRIYKRSAAHTYCSKWHIRRSHTDNRQSFPFRYCQFHPDATRTGGGLL